MLKFIKFVVVAFVFVTGIAGMASAGSAASAGPASDDVAAKVICNVVVFVQRLGLPIMTGVILGASIMAIFGKMAWASIVVLVVFTAIFFGAGKLMQKFAAGVGFSDGTSGSASNFECKGNGATKLT
ncbi:TrbC/VirB2 family protein [Anaplasma platys]|nr:TrbC/VirB2 family protein [Anaplasma platys]